MLFRGKDRFVLRINKNRIHCQGSGGYSNFKVYMALEVLLN